VTEAQLTGRTALVTGASRNLGTAITTELARRGATVAVGYRESASAAQALVDELRASTGADHIAVAGDLSTGDGARMLAEAALGEFGLVDILVNNAGPFTMAPFVELPEAEWDRIWNTNVKAAYVCTQVVAPAMREAGWGRIVNISAGSAYLRNHSIYTLAKNALITLTEQLAVELGPEITVNAVAPGQIAESADDMAAFDPTFVGRAIAASPLQRLVTRSEVATVVAELCGPRFAMVTGVTIPVDAGTRIPRF
jgi:NAD(P)-dependent dehydrogenase (short-subunit alcohol dehydrogenase family)